MTKFRLTHCHYYHGKQNRLRNQNLWQKTKLIRGLNNMFEMQTPSELLRIFLYFFYFTFLQCISHAIILTSVFLLTGHTYKLICITKNISCEAQNYANLPHPRLLFLYLFSPFSPVRFR